MISHGAMVETNWREYFGQPYGRNDLIVYLRRSYARTDLMRDFRRSYNRNNFESKFQTALREKIYKPKRV